MSKKQILTSQLKNYLFTKCKYQKIDKPTFTNQPNNVYVNVLTPLNIGYFIGKIHRQISCKLILHPFSDLTKEIEVNGEKFVPIEMLNKLQNEYPLFIEDESFFITDRCNLNMLEIHEVHVIYQKLFEWHFDLFGLIPQDLAIDINTLK